MQYEFNLPCAAQYELDLTTAPGAAEDTPLQPARPTPVDPVPASSRAG